MCSDVYAVLEALIGTSELTSIKDRYDNILCTEKAAEEYEETAEASKESSEEHSQGESVTDEVAATGEKADTSLPEQEVPEPDPEQLALCYDADLIILSPPWGGPDYLHAETYCLYTMLTCGCGLYLAMLAAAVSPNLLFLIPVNTSQQQIAHIASVLHMPFVIEYVQVNNSPKVMAVYMGEIVNHARKHQQKGKKIFKGADELINRSGHVFFDEL